MAKNEYYAIKSGKEETLGIHKKPWSDVQKMVSGVRGVVYKGFPSKEEAEQWLNETSKETEEFEVDENTLIAYVDGSSSKDIEGYGCGVALIDHTDKLLSTFSYKGFHEDANSMKNVAGELSASMTAMRQAIVRGYSKLVIYHDYEGVAKYCTKEWTAKKSMTKVYVEWYEKTVKPNLKVNFKWVKGHSGDKYNELVDELAKEGLREGKEVI